MKKDIIALLGRETHLLLLAARRRLDQATRDAAASAIEGGLDWALLMRQARRRGAAPLLDRLLGVPELSGRCPAEARTALRALARDIHIRTLRVLAQARGLLGNLQERGLEAVPIKGIFVGPYLYGEASLRPSADIDLLCRRDGIDSVQRALKDVGYKPAPAPAFFPEDDLAFLPVAHRPPLIKEGEPASVELHETLQAPAPPGFMSGVWRSAGRGRFFDLDVPVLRPADHLLFLLGHLARHWTRDAPRLQYTWLTDIALWLAKAPADFDPDEIRTRARSWGREREARGMLALTAALLDSPEADLFAARFGPVRRPSLLPLAGPVRGVGPFGRLAALGRNLRGISGWGRRLAYVKRLIAPPRDYLRARYPDRAGLSTAGLRIRRWLDFGRGIIGLRSRSRPDARD